MDAVFLVVVIVCVVFFVFVVLVVVFDFEPIQCPIRKLTLFEGPNWYAPPFLIHVGLHKQCLLCV